MKLQVLSLVLFTITVSACGGGSDSNEGTPSALVESSDLQTLNSSGSESINTVFSGFMLDEEVVRNSEGLLNR